MTHPKLLFITGSTRRRSANTAAVHTARQLLGPSAASVYDQLTELPEFVPSGGGPLPIGGGGTARRPMA